MDRLSSLTVDLHQRATIAVGPVDDREGVFYRVVFALGRTGDKIGGRGGKTDQLHASRQCVELRLHRVDDAVDDDEVRTVDVGDLVVDVGELGVGSGSRPKRELAQCLMWCVSPRLIAFGRQAQRPHLLERSGAGREGGQAHAVAPARRASSRS